MYVDSKKEKAFIFSNKDNAALNDDNHLQDNIKKMREKWRVVG